MVDTNKIITLVTGANGGIGFELATQLLADPTKHVIVCSRSIEKGEAALKTLESRKLPGTVELLQLDVNDEASIAAAAKQVESKHGRLDALVNNAAIGTPSGTVFQQTMEILRTNVAGPAAVVDAFEPLLSKSPHTVRIVNVTSGAGSLSIRLDASNPTYKMKTNPYRISKAALNMMSACQHVDYLENGWKVFLYCPGFTVSNLSGMNKAENGARATDESVAPLVDILNGKRDAENGGYLSSEGQRPW